MKVIAVWPEDPSSVPRSQEGTDSLKLPSDFHISTVAWVCTAPPPHIHMHACTQYIHVINSNNLVLQADSPYLKGRDRDIERSVS